MIESLEKCAERGTREAGAAALNFRLVASGSDGHEALLDLVETGHLESRFGDITFCRKKARRKMMRALEDEPRHLIAGAEMRGKPEGFVFASVGEYLVGVGALIVTTSAIYVSRGLRGLLLGGRAAVGLFRAVGRWAKGIGGSAGHMWRG